MEDLIKIKIKAEPITQVANVPKYPVDFVNNCASIGFIGVEIFKLVINYCLIYIIKQLGIED